MEGRALFDALQGEDRVEEIMDACESKAASASSVQEKVVYLLNAAYVAERKLKLVRKAAKVARIVCLASVE